jgi:hypothetical protein
LRSVIVSLSVIFSLLSGYNSLAWPPTDDVSAVHSFLDTIFGRCIVISFCFGGRVDALGSGRLRNNLVARKVVAAPADTPPAT